MMIAQKLASMNTLFCKSPALGYTPPALFGGSCLFESDYVLYIFILLLLSITVDLKACCFTSHSTFIQHLFVSLSLLS